MTRTRDELLAIPSVDDAVSVDAAVQHFARDSVGFVRHIERGRPEKSPTPRAATSAGGPSSPRHAR